MPVFTLTVSDVVRSGQTVGKAIVATDNNGEHVTQRSYFFTDSFSADKFAEGSDFFAAGYFASDVFGVNADALSYDDGISVTV